MRNVILMCMEEANVVSLKCKDQNSDPMKPTVSTKQVSKRSNWSFCRLPTGAKGTTMGTGLQVTPPARASCGDLGATACNLLLSYLLLLHSPSLTTELASKNSAFIFPWYPFNHPIGLICLVNQDAVSNCTVVKRMFLLIKSHLNTSGICQNGEKSTLTNLSWGTGDQSDRSPSFIWGWYSISCPSVTKMYSQPMTVPMTRSLYELLLGKISRDTYTI